MLRLGLGGPSGLGENQYSKQAGYTNTQSIDLDGTGDFVDTNYSTLTSKLYNVTILQFLCG